MISIYDLSFDEIINEDIASIINKYNNEDIYSYILNKYNFYINNHKIDNLFVLGTFVSNIYGYYKNYIESYYLGEIKLNDLTYSTYIGIASSYKVLNDLIEIAIQSNTTYRIFDKIRKYTNGKEYSFTLIYNILDLLYDKYTLSYNDISTIINEILNGVDLQIKNTSNPTKNDIILTLDMLKENKIFTQSTIGKNKLVRLTFLGIELYKIYRELKNNFEIIKI